MGWGRGRRQVWMACTAVVLLAGLAACTGGSGPAPSDVAGSAPPATGATTVARRQSTTPTATRATPLGPSPSVALSSCSVGGAVRWLGRDRTTTVGGSTVTAYEPSDGSAANLSPVSGDGFDWDRNGTPDELVADRTAGTVAVRWQGGEVVVGDVDVDISSPDEYPPVPLGSRAPHKAAPYAVADVTGDGWPDLAIASGGEIAVLAGAGTATPTGQLPFAQLGRDTLGYRFEPHDAVEALPPRGRLIAVVGEDSSPSTGDRRALLRYDEPTPNLAARGYAPPSAYLETPSCTTAARVDLPTASPLLANPPEPCASPGYLGPEQTALVGKEKLAADFNSVIYPPDPLHSSYAGSQRPFDWNLDGQPDAVVVLPHGVAIDFGGRRLTVTDVHTDFSDLHPYATIHGRVPIDVGDVTGDGNPDLLVATDHRLAVLAGRGNGETTRSLAFSDIASSGGWIVEPIAGSSEGRTRPNTEAEPHVIGDFTGDGIADIAVWSHGQRSAGTDNYTAGRPCPPSA